MYLLNEFNTSCQVHSEINKCPLDAFFLIFFLFEDEHVMVEELLELFIGEVDTKLLKAVTLLKNLTILEYNVCIFL